MKIGWFFVVVLAIAVSTIVGGISLTYLDYTSALDWPERGVRGDFWGGHIAAAGSMASVMLLILTVLMQRAELHLQREELKATREEMTRGRAVHEAQKNQLERQAEIAESAALWTRLTNNISLCNEYTSLYCDPDLPSAVIHHREWKRHTKPLHLESLRVIERIKTLDPAVEISQLIDFAQIPKSITSPPESN